MSPGLRASIRWSTIRWSVLGPLAVLVMVAGVLVGNSAHGAGSPHILWEEHFTGPLTWADPRDHGAAEIARIYSVGRDAGGSFLHARHDSTQKRAPAAIHLGKSYRDAPIPLENVQQLRWRWRARVQPAVKADPWEDMAASVYVVMKVPTLFSKGRGFKFAWLAKPGPTDTYQRGFLQVPLRTDPPSDTWKTESVDICALYRHVFGPCEGQHLLYVGVVTDADDTKSIAEADYADFELTGSP